jgi:retron-type reverse transcriptase
MTQIENVILDRQFTKLIRKSLKAGYFVFTVYQSNSIGTPPFLAKEGSIISPILANIFMHQLDLFIMNLKKGFDKGDMAKRTTISRSLEYQISKARQGYNYEKVKALIKLRNITPASEPEDLNFRRLMFVRYADDWVLGIRGTYKEACQMKETVQKFIESMKLTLNLDKTKITNINKDRLLFLGTYIYRTHTQSFSSL